MLHRAFVLSAGLIVVPAIAVAQSPAPAGSEAERAALARVLNDLGTKKGDALRDSVVSEISALNAAGKDTRTMIRLAKMGAGNNLAALQGVLVGQCLTPGGAEFCRLAALPAAAEGASVQTAATGGGGAAEGGAGGGLADGFGGDVQSNRGSNRGSAASPFSTPSFGAAASQAFNLSPTAVSSTSRSVAASAPTVSVPSPVAGAGLPLALAFLGMAAWRRRRVG